VGLEGWGGVECPGRTADALLPSPPQFVAETEEQWQHLAALRKELEELSVTLSALHVKRHQTAAEAEEEERRVLDARRLRSQLKKGLHDAQKRVDGAGHRSRAALQQLHKLLGQASQFVSAEEEVANGGMPLPADADPSDLMVTSAALAGGGLLPRGGQGPGSAGDFDDSMSCISDRYSVADDAMRVPSQPTGLVGQLLTWARGVLSIRFVLSLSEVSLTVSPGPRRRRKRGMRGTQRLRGPPLHEISEAPDVGDEGGGAQLAASTEEPGSLTQQPALRASSLHAPGSPTLAVATAASAAAQAVAAVASVGTSTGGAASGSGAASHAAVGSVHELSMRLAARAAAATGGLGSASAEFGTLRPSAFKSGAGLSSSVPVGGQGSGPNRFNRLVNMAQEKQPGGGGGQSATAGRGVPTLQPARAAPQPPPGQQQVGAPLERRGSSDRAGRPPLEVSWPMTPLSHGVSPQSSQERL
jgi:hypothetical protein